MKILVINGPNLNMLGRREPSIYGDLSLEEINDRMFKRALKFGLKLVMFQSNCEGSIVDTIHTASLGVSGMIINPAGYGHTSVAIRDAIQLLDIPVVEVHLSNIYSRESFRKKSMIADVVNGQISGLGSMGYVLAVEAIFSLCNQNPVR